MLCSFLVINSCANSGRSTGTIPAQAEDRLPFSTLAEARTFADYWVVAEVVDESFVRPEGDDASEGFVPRTMTLAVSKSLWRNDVYVQGDAIPRRFDLAVVGHAWQEGNPFR